jgi:protocatechuate 3,4-dioxygenase beta subunit
MFEKSRYARKANWLAGCVVAAVVSACGGGGGSDSCSNLPGRSASLPSCSTSSTTQTGGTAAAASVAVFLSNSSGAASTSVSPDQPATLQAVVKNSNGTPVPNAAVTFTTTDKTGVFVPSSGTALTDSNGVARITLPAGSQAGAFTVTAATTVGGTAFLGSTNYTVFFPTLTLSPMTIAPATLSSGGTASLAVTVLNGSTPFTPAQSIGFTSPCVAAGKATISSPVTTVNGVATTSYTDKGCGGADTITASTSLSGSTFSQTGTVNVQPATAGQVAFVSALPQNISLKGTGGAGRQESATVVFKVLDKNSNPVSGQAVNFTLNTTVGGLSLNPASATTGADGTVSTVVAAGTVNTPVRVTAALPGTTLATLSDQLVVSTGVPDQNSFSLSTQIFNVEGMGHDGCPAPVGSSVTVRLADHFNNPAPDGTAVSFTAEGGTVDASCLTGLTSTTLTNGAVITQKGVPGECSVRFCAASPRPADGRITILSYALGEENFTDLNGNNLVEEASEFVASRDDLGDPFRDDRAITGANANGFDDIWSSGNATRAPGETYIDSNSDGTWSRTGDGRYNGVLKSPLSVNTSPANTVHVRGALVQVLSTSEARIESISPTPYSLDHCVDGIPFVNTAKTFAIAIRDINPTRFTGNTLAGNILPAGTKIDFTASNGTLLSNTSFVVPNTAEPSSAVWTYTVSIQSDAAQSSAAFGYACTNTVTSGFLNVKVTTPLGLITTQSFSVTD